MQQTSTKMSESEFNQIDKEIQPFRVKKGSPEQVRYMELYKEDITGKLLPDGEWKWFELRKVVVLNGKNYPSVRFHDGKPLYPEYERKLNQYKWLYSRKNQDKKKLNFDEGIPEEKESDPFDGVVKKVELKSVEINTDEIKF